MAAHTKICAMANGHTILRKGSIVGTVIFKVLKQISKLVEIPSDHRTYYPQSYTELFTRGINGKNGNITNIRAADINRKNFSGGPDI
jgi:hypothetical protein